MLSLTVVVLPTSPFIGHHRHVAFDAVFLPRLIVTVRHQVDESRATISAGTSLKTERSR